jgi:hypothetical protein
MASCSNSGSRFRRLRCPATCLGGAIRPRKVGGPSLRTKPFESARSSVLLSFAGGPHGLLGARSGVRDGIFLRTCRATVSAASVESISLFQPYSSARRCRRPHAGRSAAQQTKGRPPDDGRPDTITVSLKGIDETEAAQTHDHRRAHSATALAQARIFTMI